MSTGYTAEFLNAILNSIDEGIHVVDADGVTVYYNSVAAKHDGLEMAEVMGKPLLVTFPSLNSETSTLLKVIESGQPIVNQQQTYTNMKGQQVVTVNTTLPIEVEGKLIGALEIAKDLTRIKSLSEKLIDLQAQMTDKGKKAQPRKASGARYHFPDILTHNAVMEALKKKAMKAAQSRSPVFVYGETGTGKELFVQSIHNHSARRDQPFIAQNCAALPASLLESILFGTVKGSFTGAENRPGLFELADGGTLFLDELNAMPLELQAKLLRVLQEGVIRRVGDSRVLEVDVRVMAASNVLPMEAVEQGQLRADLYYRLNVLSLEIVALRERQEDILPLAHHFLQHFNYQFNRLVTGFSPELDQRLLTYSWPGNVRELEHAIESAMHLVEGDRIEVEHFPIKMVGKKGDQSAASTSTSSSVTDGNPSRPLREALEETEHSLIQAALEHTSGNVKQAAILLDIPRQTLQYKMSKWKT